MKKHLHLGNYRKSTCVTEMLTDKQNIHRSIKSIRSFSKSGRKVKPEKPSYKDWQTLQTIEPSTPKSYRYSFLPKIERPRLSSQTREVTAKKTKPLQEMEYYQFKKILQKKNKRFKTLNISIDAQLNRLDSFTQNCSRLLNDLSDIQQKKIVSQYRSVIRSSIDNKLIEL